MAQAWRAQCKGQSVPAGVPIFVTVLAHFQLPTSISKKKKGELDGAYHIKRGDLDNVVKSILDALNGKAFPDDAAVSHIEASKFYRDKPGTWVTITWEETT